MEGWENVTVRKCISTILTNRGAVGKVPQWDSIEFRSGVVLKGSTCVSPLHGASPYLYNLDGCRADMKAGRIQEDAILMKTDPAHTTVEGG